MNSNVKGAIAEQAIVFAATKLRIPVWRPVSEHGRADLVLEIGGELQRVQVKWGRLSATEDTIMVLLHTSRRTRTGYLRSTYSPAAVDLFAVYGGAGAPAVTSGGRPGAPSMTSGGRAGSASGLLRGLERRRRIHAATLAHKLERAIGQLGRLCAADGLIAQREREQHLPQQLRTLKVRGRARRWEVSHGCEQPRGVRTATAQAPGRLVRDLRDDRSGGRIDQVDLAAQTGALERQAVARQT